MRLTFITQNLSLKIFSLAVAVLLFLFVSVESATPIEADFRIEYKTAEDIMVVGEPPQALHTTLQGPWASFRSFDMSDLTPVVIDLSTAGPGTVRHAIETSDVVAPGGMVVVSIRPSEVEVTLDRRVERQVPVQVDLLGRPALGFEVMSVTAEPQRVRVLGPMTVMQTLDYVYTRAVDVEGREEDLSLDVDLRPPPSPLRLKDKRVAVTVTLSEELVTRTFDAIAVIAENAPPGTRFTPQVVAAKLKGPRQILDYVDPAILGAVVDLGDDERRGESTTFEASVKLRGEPERTHWVGAAPKVTVLIVPKQKPKRPNGTR